MARVTESESYALSPLQQGMLYHALSSPRTGVDIEQILCRADEALDLSALEKAWAHVISRHAILRASVEYEGRSEPAMTVAPSATIPVESHDWRHLSRDAVDHETEQFLDQDRLRGIDLSRSPLMRVAVFELAVC